VHDSASELDASEWNRLLFQQARPTPFMRHEYLLALELSRSARPETGWASKWLSLTEGTTLRAACTLYLKSHSYGEYVFDWSWADAYRRHGLSYYPKALTAVPFTPVPGSRLLADDDLWRSRLVKAIEQLVTQAGLSSAHALFIDEADQAAFNRAGWMTRHGVQFHWQQDLASPVTDFAQLLQRLQREKRKKIQQERRRVADAGIEFSTHQGADITEAHWDFFHHCYTLTYQAHHSTPYLTRDFFRHMARTMPEHWLMFVASRGGTPIATSLIGIDADRRAAWGRYWGATTFVPCLHFEACYYQPLQWCLARGYERFEGGAQGEHKMARGLMPVGTRSAHWVADDRFARAIADALTQEREGIGQYVDELREHSPFKNDEGHLPVAC
jgi:predicted N-acyltransferase